MIVVVEASASHSARKPAKLPGGEISKYGPSIKPIDTLEVNIACLAPRGTSSLIGPFTIQFWFRNFIDKEVDFESSEGPRKMISALAGVGTNKLVGSASFCLLLTSAIRRFAASSRKPGSQEWRDSIMS